MTWLDRLRNSLSKTRNGIKESININSVNEEVLEELEMSLLSADVGTKATEEILTKVKQGKNPKEDLKQALMDELEPDEKIRELRKLGFAPSQTSTQMLPKSHVVMIVGINGVGKTTTIAKLGEYYMKLGKSVMFGAGDTFRAAAGTQLGIWGQRLGIHVVQGNDGQDPASVAFEAAKKRAEIETDILLLDTAGRLHNQYNLMQELSKVHRVIGKADNNEPGEVWIVIDAVTGQNGLQQAKKFNEAIPLTGVIVTKLDGTAKGGILIPIVRELKVPIKFIGIGEAAEDLQPFDAKEFIEALLC